MKNMIKQIKKILRLVYHWTKYLFHFLRGKNGLAFIILSELAKTTKTPLDDLLVKRLKGILAFLNAWHVNGNHENNEAIAKSITKNEAEFKDFTVAWDISNQEYSFEVLGIPFMWNASNGSLKFNKKTTS